jgi:hypothetical protein
MVCIDFVLRTCAQGTVVKVVISNHLGFRNGLIHFTLIPMGKIVSVYERPSVSGEIEGFGDALLQLILLSFWRTSGFYGLYITLRITEFLENLKVEMLRFLRIQQGTKYRN